MAHKLLSNVAYAAIAVATLSASATASMAQPAVCGPRADVVAWLEERFSENPVGFGLIGNHTVLEIHVSEETGSWTVLTTGVEGFSCMVSAGHSWTRIEPPVEGTSATNTAESE
jgi:hypothetical protein